MLDQAPGSPSQVSVARLWGCGAAYPFPEVSVYDYGDDYDRRFQRNQDPLDLRHICLEPVVLDRNPGPH